MARLSPRLAVVALVVAGVARADEGMWTFGRPPLAQLKRDHDFEPSDEWLDRLRLSTARVRDSWWPSRSASSGCFVGSEGLVLTCRHVVTSLLLSNRIASDDVRRDGFVAKRRDAEVRLPGAEVEILTSMEDVSAIVDGLVDADVSSYSLAGKRTRAIGRIVATEKPSISHRVEVVATFGGAQHWLHRYDRFRDVRLVFLPESFSPSVDHDTHRSDYFDAALLRVYADGKPITPPRHLEPAADAGTPTGFVALAGHPCFTCRMQSIPEFDYVRTTAISLRIGLIDSMISACECFFRDRAEMRDGARSLLDELRWDLKNAQVDLENLNRPLVVARVRSYDQEIRKRLRGDPAGLARFEQATQTMERRFDRNSPDEERAFWSDAIFDSARFFRSPLDPPSLQSTRIRRRIYDRLPDPTLEPVCVSMKAAARRELESALIASTLDNARMSLGGDDAFVRGLLGDGSIEESARSICGVLEDEESLKQSVRSMSTLFGPSLDADSNRAFDEAADAIAASYYHAFGDACAPDADSTLRLSFGKVSFHGRWTIGEFFDACKARGATIPLRWRKAFTRLQEPPTESFRSNCDVIGGNSGGPVVDRDGKLLGITARARSYASTFDVESTFTHAVSIDAILAVLRRVYDADSLADEIEGAPPK
jgi:hypothetical protein